MKTNVVRIMILALSCPLLIRCSDDTGALGQPDQRSFTFTYEIAVKDIPAEAASLEIWLPLTRTTPHQKVSDYTVQSQYPYDIVINPRHRNQMIRIDLENDIPSETSLKLSLEVVRTEDLSIDLGNDDTFDQEDLDIYLNPDRLVPISGKIAEEADSVLGWGMDRIEKARAIYDHLCATMTYDKSGKGWGQGDAVYACESRKGNCTDIHSLFIAMMRSQGIPARFLIGFPIPNDQSHGSISGYHCWAEFYTKDRGWIPVDISEAIKDPSRKDYLFGRLDPDRICFSVGRDINIQTLDGDTFLNYFIYPLVLVDGNPHERVTTTFSYTDTPVLADKP